jgi:hypothetical protein
VGKEILRFTQDDGAGVGMTIFVFGNPDLPMDALPVRLVPALKTKFPQHDFQIKDSNEEWDVPAKLIVIDTVKGIDQVQVFNGLDNFNRAPRVSMHDFDALTQLRLLQKIGRLKEVTIIGVPPDIKRGDALESIATLLLRPSL